MDHRSYLLRFHLYAVEPLAVEKSAAAAAAAGVKVAAGFEGLDCDEYEGLASAAAVVESDEYTDSRN